MGGQTSGSGGSDTPEYTPFDPIYSSKYRWFGFVFWLSLLLLEQSSLHNLTKGLDTLDENEPLDDFYSLLVRFVLLSLLVL
jgi:hypothetical protein